MKIFGPMREELRRERRKLNIEELHDLYSFSNIDGLIKRRRIW
jgi:hypothetical protein